MEYKLEEKGNTFNLKFIERSATYLINFSPGQFLKFYIELKTQLLEWDQRDEKKRKKKELYDNSILTENEYYCHFWRTFGSEKKHRKTYKEIAKKLNITPQKASDLSERARCKIRSYPSKAHPNLHKKLFNEYWDIRQPDKAPHNWPERSISVDY